MLVRTTWSFSKFKDTKKLNKFYEIQSDILKKFGAKLLTIDFTDVSLYLFHIFSSKNLKLSKRSKKATEKTLKKVKKTSFSHSVNRQMTKILKTALPCASS